MNKLFNNFNRFENVQSATPGYNYNIESGETAKPAKKSADAVKNFLHLLPLLFLLLTLLGSVYLLCVNDTNKSGREETLAANSVLNGVSNNLKLAPLEEIVPVAKGTACPAEHSIAELEVWHGSKAGCLCKDGSLHAKAFCELKSKNECEYHSGVSASKLNAFKGNSFCVKPIKEWKFVNATTDCSLYTMKKCQPTICVKGDKCPVSEVAIETGTPNPNLKDEKAYGSTQKFILTREVDKKAIVALKTEVSGDTCTSDPLMKPQGISNQVYNLDKYPQNGCGKYGDIHTYSTKIDTTTLEAFNIDNDINGVTGNLPFYYSLKSKTEPVNLIVLRRIPVSTEAGCDMPEENEVSELGNKSDEVKERVKYINWFVLGFSIGGLFLLLLFIFLRKDISIFNNKAFYILILIISLVVVAFCIWMFVHYKQETGDDSSSSKMGKNLKSMTKNKCLIISEHNEALKDSISQKKIALKNISWVIYFLFIISCFFVFALLVSFIVRKLKRLSVIPDPKY